MSYRPADTNRFLFVVMAGLRRTQLQRGCLPRVAGPHKHTVTAQLEIAAGLVVRGVDPVPIPVD
jgi:DNA-directed RNA polymerase subunit K/omega